MAAAQGVWRRLAEGANRAAASRAFPAVKLALGVAILGYVLSTLDRSALVRLTTTLGAADVAAIALVAIASHALGAVRFKALCDPVVRLPVREHLFHYFSAAYFALFLPANGGDVVRLLLLTRSGASSSSAASLVFVDRALGAVSLLWVAACGAVFAPLPELFRWSLVGAAAASTLAFLGGCRFGARLETGREWLDSALRVARDVTTPRRLASLFGLSFSYQSSAVLITVLAARSIDLPAPLSAVLALTPLVWFATMVPVSLGGLGVREAAFALLFGQVGVPAEQSVILSLGTYAGLASVGIGGGLWFTARRLSTRSTPPELPTPPDTAREPGQAPSRR